MTFKRRQMELKVAKSDIKNDGSFAGYGSVFNNLDSYRDIVMPGAFIRSLGEWAKKDALPPILWQHRSDQPIGPFTTMREDSKGLYVEGQMLVKSVRQAAETHALLQSGAIRGMSIGYNPTVEEWDSKEEIVRLKDADLWEVSIVTFPANQAATVTELKEFIRAGTVPSVREFEGLLRDVAGFTKAQAKTIVAEGYSKFYERRDAVGIESAISAIDKFTLKL